MLSSISDTAMWKCSNGPLHCPGGHLQKWIGARQRGENPCIKIQRLTQSMNQFLETGGKEIQEPSLCLNSIAGLQFPQPSESTTMTWGEPKKSKHDDVWCTASKPLENGELSVWAPTPQMPPSDETVIYLDSLFFGNRLGWKQKLTLHSQLD